ncbi:hypothetical protein LJC18_03515 [Lachnospiraceae bacterium OttesenSCG-928-E19]|nr:hypothetical protein [Lachnospiraceae bacterium OttesenSCG-928-E19]
MKLFDKEFISIVDCDETLLKTKNSLRQFYLETIDPRANIAPGTYSYNWPVWGTNNPAEMKAKNKVFCDQWCASEYFTRIEPYERSLEAIKYLRSLGPVYVLTSITTKPDQIKRRQDFLSEIYENNFTDIICLGLGASKQEALRKLGGHVFFDDSPQFVNEAINVGTAGIWVNHDQAPDRPDKEPLNPNAYKLTHWNQTEKIIETIMRSK